MSPQGIRRIPIPQDLIAAIAERQRRNPGCKLIFPNGAGNPDEHLLRIVQRVAKNAGNTFHADLHTFRRTYATLYSGTTKVQTIQYLLGHKDIKTTMRYLGIFVSNRRGPTAFSVSNRKLAKLI